MKQIGAMMGYKIEIDDELEDWEFADAKDELVLAVEDLGYTVSVTGVGIGWDRISGTMLADSSRVWDMLRLNGDYRLVAEVDKDMVTVIRYSHDEPMGAKFTISKAS